MSLMPFFGKLWDRRRFIIVVTLVFMLFGLFLAIFSPKEYMARTVFVPQTNQSFASRYSSIASMMGLDMDMSGNDGPISPKVYPIILSNPSFLRDLMYSPIHFSVSREPISIYDYYTCEEYRKTNPVEFLARYTIGLPGLIIGALRGNEGEDELPQDFAADSDGDAVAADGVTADGTPPDVAANAPADGIPAVIRLNRSETAVAKLLYSNITMEVDIKRGFLTLTVMMPEAVAASEVCETAYMLLKRYVSDFKIEKGKVNLSFLEGQYEEAKENYRRRQYALASYIDRNRGVISAQSSVERSRLESDCELARSLYQELAKNVLSSRVKLEENNVAFVEIAPSSVPLRKAKPSGVMLLFVWTFLGGALSCGWVLGRDYLDKLKNSGNGEKRGVDISSAIAEG